MKNSYTEDFSHSYLFQSITNSLLWQKRNRLHEILFAFSQQVEMEHSYNSEIMPIE